MKKFSTITLTLSLFVVFLLPTFALAATSPGIKPGSPLYFFDTTFEKVSLFFTFGSEKKARKALEYADERLAEAEAVADNAKGVKTAIISYESNIAFAAEKSKDVKEAEKAEALLSSIADNTSKHQEVLEGVLAKVPDEAKEAITNAIEASRKGHEEAMQKIAELKGEVEQLKQEAAELKAKDEEQEKIIDEQNTQRPKTADKPTPTQTTTKQEPSETPEATTSAPEPESAITQPSAQTETEPNEPQASETSQSSSDTTINAESAQTTQTESQPSVSIQISSINVTPALSSAQIEWKTNMLTNSKVFVSGNGLSKVFNSESGFSTRHIVTVTGLSAGTSYSYEIETVTGEQNVSKTQGSFNTIDKSEILVTQTYGPTTPDPVNNVPYGAYGFKVSVLGKLGKYDKNALIHMDAPSDNVYWGQEEELTKYPNGVTTSELGDWNAGFEYVPTTTGTKTITFSSGSLIKSIIIEVTE